MFNEGWNAYLASNLLTGDPLYYPSSSYITNNYPPLSFLLAGGLGRLGIDALIAGRLLSIAGFLVVCGGIVVCLREMRARWLPAFFGMLVFASYMFIKTNYVGANEPQLLGHGLAMSGLSLCLIGRRRPLLFPLGMVAIALSLFTKQMLVITPGALFLWWLVHERRTALRLFIGLFVLGCVGLLLSVVWFGTNFLSGITSPRTYSIYQMINTGHDALIPLQIPIMAAILLIGLRPRDSYAQLCFLIAGCGLIIGLAMMSAAGVSSNALLDGVIGLSLSSGLLLDRIGYSPGGQPMLAPALATVAGFYIAFMMPLIMEITRDDVVPWRWLDKTARIESATDQDVAMLRTARDPVLCEELGLCYMAGRKFSFDAYYANQGFKVGRLSEATFLDQIARHEYSVVQLGTQGPLPPETSPHRFSDAFYRAILTHYRLDHISPNGSFFLPK